MVLAKVILCAWDNIKYNVKSSYSCSQMCRLLYKLYLAKASKLILQLQQFVPISRWTMFVYILFVVVIIVFVWVVRWFMCWEGNSVTAPLPVCICTNTPHSLCAYETFWLDTTETNPLCFCVLRQNVTLLLIITWSTLAFLKTDMHMLCWNYIMLHNDRLNF